MSNIHKIVANGLVLRDKVIIVQLWKIWQGEFFNCLSQLLLVSGADRFNHSRDGIGTVKKGGFLAKDRSAVEKQAILLARN